MRTVCNPGSFLQVEGRFSISTAGRVWDTQTGEHVSLQTLLRQFLYDPDEARTGPIRITIEPVPL